MANRGDAGMPDEGSETFFESLSDLLIGVIFIFIIILMSFALNMRVAQDRSAKIEKKLSDAGELRGRLLRAIEAGMQKKKFPISIDQKLGIVRLPEDLLFASGSADLGKRGQRALAVLAGIMAQSLPCYSSGVRRSRSRCPRDSHPIFDVVLIEGHTDSVPVHGEFNNNWELSAARSQRTYQALVKAASELKKVKNVNAQSLLSISAYADTRPPPGYRSKAEVKRHSRRIDIRFVIGTPRLGQN